MDMVYLEEKMAESGLRKEYIAKQIGLSRFGLRDKMLNPKRWKVVEMTALISLLKLSKADSKRIFNL